MYSKYDEKKGVCQTNWGDVRKRFEIADPVLTGLIDNVSPSNDTPIYLIYFPYGALKGDANDSFLPLLDGGFIKLSDLNLDKRLIQDLGYGMSSSPLGIILDKYIEYFIEFDEQVFPYQVAGPGTIFNKNILLKKGKSRNYTPNGILKATAGTRTAFMLPSINSHNGINKLSKLVNQELTTPRKLSDHFDLFKAINQNENSSWTCCLAYFSEKWIHHLTSDPAWVEIKNYILEEKNTSDSFNANSAYYDIFYSKVQKDRNLRTSSPYLTNTAMHLIKVALGEHPGFAPATMDNLLPLNHIQEYIAESFQLKKTPSVMTPHTLVFEKDTDPVYYSMQNPTTPHLLTKKNERVTANQEIDVLHGILSKFVEEMSKKDSLLAGTAFAEIATKISFNYFHNFPPQNSQLILNSRQLSELDPRFEFCAIDKQYNEFSFEGQFLRGCIQIKPNLKQ